MWWPGIKQARGVDIWGYQIFVLTRNSRGARASQTCLCQQSDPIGKARKSMVLAWKMCAKRPISINSDPFLKILKDTCTFYNP